MRGRKLEFSKERNEDNDDNGNTSFTEPKIIFSTYI